MVTFMGFHAIKLVELRWIENRKHCFAKRKTNMLENIKRETNVSAYRVRWLFRVSRNKLSVTTNHHSKISSHDYKMVDLHCDEPAWP